MNCPAEESVQLDIPMDRQAFLVGNPSRNRAAVKGSADIIRGVVALLVEWK